MTPRPLRQVVDILLRACVAEPDDVDVRDAIAIAPAVAKLARADLLDVGEWLFGDGRAPDPYLIAHLVCRLDREPPRAPETHERAPSVPSAPSFHA